MNPKLQAPTDFDPFSPETLENPYPFFAALRRESPVFHLEKAGFTLISRYADVRAAAMDPETFSSNAVSILMKGEDDTPHILPIGPKGPRPVDVLALADPPTHTRQRMLVNKMFTGRQIINLRPTINRLANELFNEISKSENVKWMKGFANPLPMQLILEIVGFPAQDAERLTQWSVDTLALITKIQTPESMASNVESTAALTTYLAKLLVVTKSDPGKDMLGTLALATRGISEALTDREAVSIAFQLLSAGQDTTSSLLGSAVMMLAQDEGLQEELRHDISLVPAFIEEVVRLESPFITGYGSQWNSHCPGHARHVALGLGQSRRRGLSRRRYTRSLALEFR